jgi:hypothetical protein
MERLVTLPHPCLRASLKPKKSPPVRRLEPEKQHRSASSLLLSVTLRGLCERPPVDRTTAQGERRILLL